MSYVKYINLKVNYLLCYFVTCSFIGWCIETTYMAFIKGRLVSGGFFAIPFRPIYGFAAIVLIILLKSVRHNIILFFIGAVFITSIVEYLTGVFLQTVYKKTLWDYHKEFLSIGGLVCLKFSILWGILSTIFMYLFQPLIHHVVIHIPLNLRIAISFSAVLLLLFNLILSAASISGIDLSHWLTG